MTARVSFRSVANLDAAVVRNLWRLPTKVDTIIAVPRSGLIPASLIALYMNRPLMYLDGVESNIVLSSGSRVGSKIDGEIKSALVVDDSVNSGGSIRAAKQRLDRWSVGRKVEYFAAYVTSESKDQVDHYLEVVDNPRFFQWNLLQHGLLKYCCVDIDGVLCRDPTELENDDGVGYLRFLSEVEPKFVPKYRIGWLVTSRLEKYRSVTEEWLQRNGIQYDELVMMPYSSKAERIAAANHGGYKAEVYSRTAALLFIESNIGHAVDIAKYSGKQVVCTDTMTIVNPSDVDALKARLGALPGRSAGRVRRGVSRLMNRLLP